MIYFIQDTRTLEIKIGYTSGDAATRLAALQTGNPGELRVLLETPGDYADEAELHRRFAAARGNGEWFRPTPEVLAYMLQAQKTEAFVVGMERQRKAQQSCDAFEADQAERPESVLFQWLRNDETWGGDVAKQQLRRTLQVFCPVCGGNNNHVREPEPLSGHDDWHGSGGGVRVPMWCECGHNWSVCLGFHKGESFMFAASDEPVMMTADQVETLNERYGYKLAVVG